MFTLTVTGHMMIAHSLADPFFGPAQGVHGATYVAEVTFSAPDLDHHGVVIDIGAAQAHLDGVLADLTYRNLDDHPGFAGTLSTTEVLARYVAEQVAARLGAGHGLTGLQVVLREHPGAWAGYTMDLAPRSP